MRRVSVEQTRTVPSPRADAFATTIPIDLTVLFSRWYGPIPPIREVRGQTGAWTVAGRHRTVVLAGGGSMHEELTAVEAPESFAYRLTEITGALRPLFERIDGRWRFDEADGGGTTIRWAWTLHPRSALARPIVVVIGRLWTGYARQALERLERHIAAAG